MPSIDEILIIIFNHPLTYIIVIIVGFVLIINKINEGKLRPEQKADFGVKYRASRTKKHLDKRGKALAIKVKKCFIFRDLHKIGKVLSIEDIPTNPEMLYAITYRRLGFFNWFISIFGFGCIRIIMDEKNLSKGYNKTSDSTDIVLNTNLRFRERGGTLILSRDAEKKLIDEINADADYENAKGFVSDFPRRLSNLHPTHAMSTDTLELEENLEEKKRKSFIDRFRRGG